MNTSTPETAKEAARRLSAPMLDKGFKPVALHTYTDVDGTPIYCRIRCKHPDTKEKWIRPMKLNGQGYEMGEPKFQNGKPLYALHRIANNPEAIVWITEGEQKADALNKLGLVASTSGSATSADATDWEPLRGKTIKIFPDNDAAGKAYAGIVASILLSMGCTVSCVDVDKLGLGTGDDVMEWLAFHPEASAADIEALPINPALETNNSVQSEYKRPIRAVDLHELAKMQFKLRDPLLEPWLHSQDLCMVYAARGIGKTHFSLAVAYAVATGGRFLDWQATQPCKVLYLDGELPGNVMQTRLLMHLPEQEPQPGYFSIFTPDLLGIDELMPDLATPQGQAIINTMIEPDTALVVVYNLSAWARGTRAENDAESWLPIASWVLALRRRGIAVMLVHHAGKGGDQRGTSKREDLLDIVIRLSRPNDYDPKQGARFEMTFTKSRNLHGADAEGLEVNLLEDSDGSASWRWNTLEGSTYLLVIDLANEGLSQTDIARELEVNRSTVNRHYRRAHEEVKITKPKKEASL